MFRKPSFPHVVSNQEIRWLTTPAALASLVLFSSLTLIGIQYYSNGLNGTNFLLLGIGGMIYTCLMFFYVMPFPARLQRIKWSVSIINSLAIGVSLIYLHGPYQIVPEVILVLVAAVLVIIWDRAITYVFIIISIGIFLIQRYLSSGIVISDLVTGFALMIISGSISETIHRFTDTSSSRVKRLEIINDFAHEIGLTLEVNQLLNLVSGAIQNAIEADTYFVGTCEEDHIKLHLTYDDGEFFPPKLVPMEGSLSGWVIQHQQSLFIPDLRREPELDGVHTILIGREKSNLCWMGVPMHSGKVSGMIVVASYTPNDFDRTDLELLENLAQQAALALDNAAHHSEVEEQSRLDSLTRCFNHSHIVQLLHDESEKHILNNQPLTLIMLDIDHFKLYNDNYGHQMGDQVLIVLTDSIRKHIKSVDSIGRWGGEEFAIVLPGTDGRQADLVAQRIQETMSSISLSTKSGEKIPVPTVSQGIAVFPDETPDIDRLIDLADQRLYIAKERGRNQVEPSPDHWKHSQIK